MKLFKSLLVAPATLGLLAPMSVTANELNLNDVSGYSSSEEVQNINEFNSAEELAVTNSRVDGLEARFNNFEAGSFSDTTTASFGSTFYVGAVDGSATGEAVTFSYDFAMDLSTSFTGDDSLDIAVIGGNAGATATDGYMGGDSTDSDQLQLDGVSYTFPLGGASVIVGDGVGVDDMNTGACAYSAFTDLLGDCGTSSVGGSADSAIAIGYDFGNGFTVAGGVGGGDSTSGYFTEEDASTIGLEAAYTTDLYGLSVAYTDDEASTYWSIQEMIARETKRQRLVQKYAQKRAQFKQDLRNAGSIREVVTIHRQLQTLPRNSAPVRLHNRCVQTGRPKGYYRDFGLSRHVLREMVHQCLLPGVRKASW